MTTTIRTTITRTAHTRTCTECEGSGELTYNPSHYGDPQCEVEETCDACNGDGELTLWVDPLITLNRALTRRTFRAAAYPRAFHAFCAITPRLPA